MSFRSSCFLERFPEIIEYTRRDPSTTRRSLPLAGLHERTSPEKTKRGRGETRAISRWEGPKRFRLKCSRIFPTTRVKSVNQCDLIVDDSLFPARVYTIQSRTIKTARGAVRGEPTFVVHVIVSDKLVQLESGDQSGLARLYRQKTPE
jgi:hypothetical protein